jgi:hypothetical protein
MIRRVDDLSRFIEPLKGPAAAGRRDQFALILQSLLSAQDSERNDMSALLNGTLRLSLLEALARRSVEAEALPAPPPPPMPPAIQQAPPSSEQPPAGQDEAAIIREASAQAGIDPDFLAALRRVENGGPGREFGVLSAPAPTYRDQARVAAESVRKNIERFRGEAVDPVTGRYTEPFIRFFSRRYAPEGADNDPMGLNRFHSRNLIKVYQKLSGGA